MGLFGKPKRQKRPPALIGDRVSRAQDFDPQTDEPSKPHGHRFANPETKAAFEAWLSNLRGDAGGAVSALEAQGPDPAAADASTDDKKPRPNPEHLAKLKQGRAAWNGWRSDNPTILPELQGISNGDLKGSGAWMSFGKQYEDADGVADLTEMDLSQTNFYQAALSRANFTGSNLEGANFLAANLSDAILMGTKLAGSEFSSANLSDAILTRAECRDATFAGTNLEGATLQYASFWRARLSQSNLTVADLRGADFRTANMWSACLRGADATDADFRGAWLPRVNFTGTSLFGAKLNGSELADAVLDSANLSYASLAPLRLPKPLDSTHPELAPSPPPLATKMHGCSLRNANLDRADLTSADLSGSDLTSASIRNAILDGSNVSGVKYNRSYLVGKCYGVNADSMYGDATFRRDVMDQDYIDTLYIRMEREWPTWATSTDSFWDRLKALGANIGNFTSWVTKDLASATAKSSTWFAAALAVIGAWVLFQSQFKALSDSPSTILVPAALGGFAIGLFFNTWFGRRSLLALWSLLGYGRDWDRVAIFASVMIGVLGFIYSTYGCYQGACDTSHAFQFFDGKQPLDQHPVYPWYIAALGFATLGISDLIRPLTGFGMLIVSLNVLAGFSTLGLLLAVLSDRFARRA